MLELSFICKSLSFVCDSGVEVDIAIRDVGGNRDKGIWQALYELVILPLRKPELFSHEKLLGPQKGVLEFGAVFINMRISNLMSKWFGDALELPHVTPSHKQQSVPSFHVSVLGCWQFHEAKLLMEKDSLNWSKERLWS
ncbi:hypothetical protein NC652_028859 [Populus alba x Populus x berolinensis]|nr:hypothetical protein NC652_028859 [Populus alba x Populus x berolinensis]